MISSARIVGALRLLGLAALAVLFLDSPGVQLWLGRAGDRASRCFSHHLLPLRIVSNELVAQAAELEASPEPPTCLETYAAWMNRLAVLRDAGMSSPELEQARGRMELWLARRMIASQQADLADWHLLEAVSALRERAELEAAAALARQNESWRALALALASLGKDAAELSTGLPAEPQSRGQLEYWLGRVLADRKDFLSARRHWQSCAQLQMPRCHSSLASLALEDGDPAAALEHHRQALALDPNHWPSLARLLDTEKHP